MSELKDIQVDHVALLKKGKRPANQREILLYRSTRALEGGLEMEVTREEKAPELKVEAMPEVKAELKTEVIAPVFPTEPVYRADGSFDLSGVDKSQVEIVKAVWTARKEASEAKAQLKAQQREMARVEFVARSKEKLSHLPGGNASEHGELLLKASESLDKEAFNRLIAVLEQASAALKQGEIFKSYGRPGPAIGGTAERFEHGVQKYAADNKLSYAKAFEQFSKTAEGARLYDESQAQ